MVPPNTPAFEGGDLPAKERLAYEQGHDADVAPIEGVAKNHKPQTFANETSSEARKPDSSNTSINEPLDDHEKGPIAAEQEQEALDPNIVDWDGPDDPANPVNWSATRKWTNIAVLSALTLLTPLASSMFAPGVPEVMRTFHSDNENIATFVVSVYLLGFAFGPLVVAPLSELYGRAIVYHVCNLGFILFTVACALSTSMNMLIGFRFLAGIWGIAPITNGGGTIADLMKPEQRGGAMAIWAMGPLLGPVIGPVAGGFLAQAEGWRWIFWVIAIAIGVMTIAGFFALEETYPPTLLERKTRKLRKETGNLRLRSKLDQQLPAHELFIRAIVRPTKLLFLSPICALMSLYMAFVYAILYLLFTTFTFVFEDNYGFSQGTVGLVYIGCGIGMLLGLAILGKASDPLMQYLARKHNDGKVKPEYRLPMLIYAGTTIPLGLFLYGWTAQYHIQWAVPLLGTLFVGIGLIAAFMCINTYLVDTFTIYAASAMAANTVLRSLFGATFPLFGLSMYNTLGLGWGNSLLAFIALAMCPIPLLFYWYGAIQDPDFILLTEPELRASPMEDIHKDLALLHFRRLHRVPHAQNPAPPPFRNYLARAKGGMAEDVSESMIADVVEACLGLDNPGRGAEGGGDACFGPGAGAARFPDGRRIGGDEHLTQEPHTYIPILSPTSVNQLRSPPPKAAQAAKASCLPAETLRDDLGSELDWANLLHRSRSEDDVLHRDKQARHFHVLEARDRIRSRLLRSRLENGNGISWPPAPPPVETLPAAMPALSSLSPLVSSPPSLELREGEERKKVKARATDHSALLPPPPPPAAAPVPSYSSAPTNTAASTTTTTRRSRKRTDVSETLAGWKDYLVRNNRHLVEWFRNSVTEGREKGVDVFVD
ncbi:MFS general substrate transporter [Hortaea werneckii]|nr:MFS general substrate transporter [Hortaea werneckii]KAI7052057.1 MFS general substrate transporter [Hortaea werneckii]KAI7421451.1 MFS general substrate transporter [Hortaea werneckii]